MNEVEEEYSTEKPAILKWIDEKTSSTESKYGWKQWAMTVFGLSVGAISAYVMYELGRGFGEDASEGIKDATNFESDHLTVGLEEFFGWTAVVAMSALGAINTWDNFVKMVTPKSESKEKILKNNSPKWRWVSKNIVLNTLGVFSFIPQSMLTWYYLDGSYFRIPVTITAIIAPFYFNKGAGEILKDRFFNYISKGNEVKIIAWRSQLIVEITKKTAEIAAADSEANLETYNAIFASEVDSTKSAKLWEKTQTLIGNDFYNEASDDSVNLTTCCSNWFSRDSFIGYIGFVLGAAGAVAYYNLGQWATSYFLDQIGVNPDPETEKILRDVIGFLAYILNGALAAVNTQDRFQQFFSKQNKPIKLHSQQGWRKVAFWLGIIFGALSATPLTYIAIQDAIKAGTVIMWLLVPPTFLAPFSVRSKASENLENRFITAIDKCFFSNDATKSDILLTLSQDIAAILPRLSDEVIEQLFKALNPTKFIEDGQRESPDSSLKSDGSTTTEKLGDVASPPAETVSLMNGHETGKKETSIFSCSFFDRFNLREKFNSSALGRVFNC